MPYLPESEMAYIGRYLPQGIQDRGREIRTFMPRYGCINERRHQLHEVIRLSGMNLVINEADHPLIIKVASIQSARMQIYFIDNDDYFQGREIFAGEDQVFYPDNDERAIFFARGVFETARKLRWAPDVVYCQGWFSALAPIYLKKEFIDDPVFENTKVIVSTYNDQFEGTLAPNMAEKMVTENISREDLALIEEPSYVNLMKLAYEYADAVIFNHPDVLPELREYVAQSGKPTLEYSDRETFIEQYAELFDTFIIE